MQDIGCWHCRRLGTTAAALMLLQAAAVPAQCKEPSLAHQPAASHVPTTMSCDWHP